MAKKNMIITSAEVVRVVKEGPFKMAASKETIKLPDRDVGRHSHGTLDHHTLQL